MKSAPFTVLAVVLLIVFYFFFLRPAHAAAPTMQNDTESIALPTGTNDQGDPEVIYDNPYLINQWAQGSNDPYAEYLASLSQPVTGDGDSSATVSVGDDEGGASPEQFVDTFNNFGFTYTPPAEASGSGSGGTLTITASKLREALAQNGIVLLNVKGWDFTEDSFIDDSEYYQRIASFDYSDLTVIAAAVVFRDQNIEEVTLSGSRINVTYRTKGWLLGFIPIHFRVSLSINSAGKTDAERVYVKFPWYRYFTWVLVSPQELAASLNASIVGLQAAGLGNEETQARLFTYVGALLSAQSATDISGIPRE